MKPIAGYAGLYSITKRGRVWSEVSKKWMGIYAKGHYYLRTHLIKNKIGKHHYIHHLVADAFLPKKKGFNYINHKDGNKHNNLISNLERCTKSQDCQHAWDTGLRKVTPRMIAVGRRLGRKSGLFSKSEVKAMRKLSSDGFSQKEIGLVYGVTRESARDIILGRSYGHIK